MHGLRETGERHHDNAGGSRKLSAVAAGHTMEVKERHYEKVGEDFEQVHESYRNSILHLWRIGYPTRHRTMNSSGQIGDIILVPQIAKETM